MKRANGRFYFRMEHGGRHYYRSLGTRLDEAKRRAKQLKVEIEAGPGEKPERLSVKAFGARWLSEYVAQRRNEKGCALASHRLSEAICPAVESEHGT